MFNFQTTVELRINAQKQVEEPSCPKAAGEIICNIQISSIYRCQNQLKHCQLLIEEDH